MQDIRVERIIVVDVPKKFAGSKVKVMQGGKEWETSTSLSSKPGKAQVLTIRDPNVHIGEDWEIRF
jgi:hypothetical protein